MHSIVSRLSSLRPQLPGRQHWPSTLVLAVMAGLYLFAGFSVISFDTNDGRAFARGTLALSNTGPVAGTKVPPVPEPLAFRDMTPQEAAAHNASIPISSESNPAARAFILKAAGQIDQLRALDCLTAAVHYEAAIEPLDGQRAVAQVVLNRLRHPAYPKSVCGVVFQGSERSTGCQFTFTCDGSLARTPSEAGWARARKVAEEALAGKVFKPVGYATHYHTNWVVPYWSSSLTKLANVGTHIFYRWEGSWGRPPAFRFGHQGVEAEVRKMAGLSEWHSETRITDADLAMAVVVPEAPLTADLSGRAVVRRYEPLREQAAASTKTALAKAEVPSSLRWALTGEGAADGTPLGTKPQAAPVVASNPAPAAQKKR